MEEKLQQNPNRGETLIPKKKKGNYLPAIIIAGIAIVLVSAGAVLLYRHNQEIKAQQAAAEQERLAIEEQQKMELAIAQNEEYDAIVNSSTFLPGVTVNGTPIGGLTMEEANTLLEETYGSTNLDGSLLLQVSGIEVDPIVVKETTEQEEAPADGTDLTEQDEATEAEEAEDDEEEEPEVTPAPLADGKVNFSLSCVSASSNINDVLTQAFKLARNGSRDSVLAEAADIRDNGRDFTLEIVYDFSNVPAEVDKIANAIDRPVENAGFGSIDKENHTVEITKGREGISVDRNSLCDAIISAISENRISDTIEVPYSLIPIDESKQTEIRSFEFTTSFKGSSKNRIFNITKGAGLINGRVLKPGEVFSTNDTLGKRTTKNGWKLAHAYVNGTTEEQAGGGVCQLSSTLYNCVVMSDLEIVYRQNHSMKVTYVSQGLDATINSVGNMIDFKFKNNTNCDVVIFAYTSGNNLTMKVYRCAFDTDEYDSIKLTSQKVKTLSPSGDWNITLDSSKAPGYEEITQDRKNGSIWQSYKHYYLNGKEVKVEKLATSTYKAYPGAKIVGPEPVATPTPSPTPKPSTPAPDPETPKPETPKPETTSDASSGD